MSPLPAIGAVAGKPFGGIDALEFYKSQGVGAPSQTTGAQGTGFADLLKDKLGSALEIDAQGSAAAQSIATGTAQDISAATIAVQKAAITEQLVAGVRNKAIEAYQDIMRMQV